MPCALFGSSTSTVFAPSPCSVCSASLVRASVSASAPPASKKPRGRPMRSPDTSPLSAATQFGAGSGYEVASRGSWPAITPSSSAASAQLRANGPIWSSELANATSP